MKKLIIVIAPLVIGTVCMLSACGGKSSSGQTTTDSTAMMTQKNKQTALNSVMALIRHDTDGVLKDAASDFVDLQSGDMKPMKLDSAKAGLKAFFTSFPDVKADSLTAVAQGDTVIIMAIWTGTFKGAMGPIKPTGKSFKVRDADIYIFNKEGKIASHRSVQSSNTYFSQVGITMPPGH